MNCLRIRILSLGCLTALGSLACACEREQHIRIINDADRELGVDLTVPARAEALIRFKKIKDLGMMDTWKKAMLYDLEAHNKVMGHLKNGEIQIALDIIKKNTNLSVFAFEYLVEIICHFERSNPSDLNDFVQELIKHGCDINFVWYFLEGRGGQSIDVVNFFLENGANPSQIIKTYEGKCITPLLKTLGIEIVSRLDINQPFWSGRCCILPEGYKEMFNTLLKHGADVNQVLVINESTKESWTPLLLAIYNCRIPSYFKYSLNCVSSLLEAGADVNQHATPRPCDQNFLLRGTQTPLSLAFNLGLTEIVKVLLEHGATL